MSKFTGNIIRLPAVTPTQNSASGVYTLDDQFTAQSSGTWPIVRDQYFNYTTLLLTGAVQGTAYPNPVTQPYSFLSDASTNNFVVSPNGDVSARPFNPYLNNYSNFFSGSGQYLTATNSSAFYLSTGNFTVEAWIYRTAASSGNAKIIVGQTQNTAVPYAGWLFFVTSSDFLRFEGSNGVSITASITVPLNQWVHVAAVRVSSTTTIYMNGVPVSSGSVSITDFSGLLTIGQYTSAFSGPEWIGYISNLRIVKGTAVYTSSFTPPTQPLQNISGTSLLTCQSNRFIDNSTANSGSGFPITVIGSPAVSQNSPFVSYDTTNGSGYFDGTGDWLNPNTTSANLALGSGDFTIEFWLNTSRGATRQYIFDFRNNGSTGSISPTTAPILIWGDDGADNNGNWLRYAGISNGTLIANADLLGVTLSTLSNQWNHIAIVRSSGTVYGYLNGSRKNSVADSTNYNVNCSVSIAAAFLGTANYLGNISDFRVVKGTAVYTGTTYTVPTAPLQAITNTSLLTLQTRAPATNNGFIDSSPNNFVVTRNGNTTQGSFSPFSPTGWGNRFDGTSGQLAFPTGSFVFGNSDFTIEAWVYNTGTTTGAFFTNQYTSGATTTSIIGAIGSLNGNFDMYIGSSVYSLTGINPTANQWVHLAIVRTGGTVSVFQNGNRTHTRSDLSTLSINAGGTAVPPQMGNGVNGYMSNHRIIIGSGPYDATQTSITVPTTPLTAIANTKLLTCQANRFRDASPNNLTITVTGSPSVQAFSPFAPAQSYIPSQIGGSGYFDGTGSGTAADYLTVPDSPVFTLGSGDFTLETWIYSTVGSGAERYYIAHTDNATAAASQFALYQRSADAFILFEYYVSTTANSITSGAAITLNQWNHIAVCRSNGTLSMFVNGVRPATGTTNISTTAFNDSASSLGIGGRTSGAALLTGNISGMRLVRGTDIYGASNTTITVPTAPPTAIPNTSLLLNFTNGGIVDATGKNNLETVGNSGVQTSVIKYGNGSIGLNGASGTYLNAAPTGVPLGSGDFVVECWVYLNASKAQGIFDTRATNTSTTGIALYLTSGNVWQMVINNAGVNFGGSITNSVWTHVAVVRTGSTIYVYSAGSLVNSSPSSNNLSDTTFLLGTLRDNADATTTWKLNGYVDDLRITKGYNRGYSGSTITVPTGPFPLG